MAYIKITVNGRSVEQWIDEEENQDIRQFYTAELRMMGRTSRRQIVTHTRPQQSKVEQLGNGSIRVS